MEDKKIDTLENKVKISKVREGFAYIAVPVYMGAVLVNKVIQEGKHAYYHLRDIPHTFIDNDSNTSFSYYTRN